MASRQKASLNVTTFASYHNEICLSRINLQIFFILLASTVPETAGCTNRVNQVTPSRKDVEAHPGTTTEPRDARSRQ